MKNLGIITLFLLAIIISVGVSVYMIQQQQTKNSTQRFQLVFGEIIHESTEPSNEPDISVVTKKPEAVCFKFDTLTGQTWRYVSSFYKDPNQLVTTLGFETVPSENFVSLFMAAKIRHVSERNKSQMVLDDPAKPKKTINDLRREVEK